MAATLVFRLTGGSSNNTPSASLGGVMSSNALSGTAMNNLFDDVDPTEATSGDIEYRMVDVYNSGDATATVVQLYISSQTSSAATSLDLGADGTNNPHTAAWNGETLATEQAAPAAPVITFGAYPVGAKLSLPDIPAGQACRVCLRRTVNAGAGNTSNDACAIAVQYA